MLQAAINTRWEIIQHQSSATKEQKVVGPGEMRCITGGGHRALRTSMNSTGGAIIHNERDTYSVRQTVWLNQYFLALQISFKLINLECCMQDTPDKLGKRAAFFKPHPLDTGQT